MIYDGIIVGAGAAGLYAAGSLNKGKYLLLEGEAEVGNKIRISGAGQCNFTFNEYPNMMMTHYGDHGQNIKGVLKTLSSKKVMKEFKDYGVESLIREDGKVFPASLRAEDIIRALLNRMNKEVVSIKTKVRVRKIIKTDDLFLVSTDEETFKAKRLLIATGGGSFRRTGSDGFGLQLLEKLGVDIKPFSHALVPITVNQFELSALAGVSLENAKIRFDGKTKEGDLLITAKGFSGPVIINNSRWFKDGMEISVDFSNHQGINVENEMLQVMGENGSQTVRYLINHLPYPQRLLRELWKEYLDMKLGEISKDIRKSLVKQLCDYRVKIMLYPLDQGMATSGGVSVGEINFKTMEVKSISHLYVAGEVTDIDGDTGGYNIHYAFASGYIAAISMEKSLH